MKAIAPYIFLFLLLAGCVAQSGTGGSKAPTEAGGGAGGGKISAEAGARGSSLITITCAVDHRARTSQVPAGTTLADCVDSVRATAQGRIDGLPWQVRVRRGRGFGNEQIHEFSLRQADASGVRPRLESFVLQDGDFIVFTYPIP